MKAKRPRDTYKSLKSSTTNIEEEQFVLSFMFSLKHHLLSHQKDAIATFSYVVNTSESFPLNLTRDTLLCVLNNSVASHESGILPHNENNHWVRGQVGGWPG